MQLAKPSPETWMVPVHGPAPTCVTSDAGVIARLKVIAIGAVGETRVAASAGAVEVTVGGTSRRQVALQPSPPTMLSSSHSSPGSRLPSPQPSSSWQLAEQPSPPALLPSSHSSPIEGCTMLSPHGRGLTSQIRPTTNVVLVQLVSPQPPVASTRWRQSPLPPPPASLSGSPAAKLAKLNGSMVTQSKIASLVFASS